MRPIAVRGTVFTVVALGLLPTFTGCATLSNRAKTLLLMGGVGMASASLGYALAPSDARPEMSATYFGAVGAAIAGVVGLFVFDEEKRSGELDRQNAVIKKELEAYRDEGGSHEPELLYDGSAPFGKEIPTEYQGLVRPGHWSVYRLNQWVTQGEGTIIHQDRLMKLVPPQLNPVSAGEGSEPKPEKSETSGKK